MILPIVPYGKPVLRQKGKPVTDITTKLCKLVDDMIETMNHAEGVGLAAQQVGEALQLAVIDITEAKTRESRMWIKDQPVDPLDYMPLVLINPELTYTKKKVSGNEGCLSFPGISANISRPFRVHVRTQNLEGKWMEFDAGGLLGRAIQHEYDHLQGKLFIDLMDPEDRKLWRAHIEAIELGKPLPPEPQK